VAEIKSLTALRGIAAIWIVLHHFWPQTAGATPFLIAKGYLAVDLFFILSGLVLTLAYKQQILSGRFDLREFAIRRFARLYPVHFITLISAAVILAAGPYFGFQGRPLEYDLVQMIFLQLTLLHAWGLTETGGLNYPSWSLSAEAFAYLLFPVLALIVFKRRYALPIAVLFLITCFFGFEAFWPDTLRHANDAWVFTRLENDFGALRILPEFSLGVAIGTHIERFENGVSSIVSGTLCVAVGLATNIDIVTVFGFAALLAGCVIADPKAGKITHTLGRISYSIYMCHALIEMVGFRAIETFFSHPDRASPTLFLIPMVGLTILCAAALHHWVERPAHRWICARAISKSHPPKVQRFGPNDRFAPPSRPE